MLDPTASEATIFKSIRHYFVTAIETAQELPVAFDSGIDLPDLQDVTLDRWVSITIGQASVSGMSAMALMIYCCSRKDIDGEILATVRDTVFETLIDPAQPDGRRRIPIQTLSGTTWTATGSALLVDDIREGERLLGKDGTKFKLLTVRLRWGAMA
jgi:hypothetical protein